MRRRLLHVSEGGTTAAVTTRAPKPQVRCAARTDLAAVERLLSTSKLPLDGVREALPSFVVAEAGNEIVGVAGLERCRENALLRSVAVAHSWRSRGLARVLITHVLSDADVQGVRALYLLTTTAAQYFPRFGFREIGRDEVPDDVRATVEFQSGCPASATVMVRRIGDASTSSGHW